MRLAAAVIEPVSLKASSNSTLPGPKAICLPTRIRKHGRICALPIPRGEYAAAAPGRKHKVLVNNFQASLVFLL